MNDAALREALDLLDDVKYSITDDDVAKKTVSDCINELDNLLNDWGALNSSKKSSVIKCTLIESAEIPKNVYLNEDTKKLLDKLEKKVGHGLTITFADREHSVPMVEVEKYLPNNKGVSEGYLDRLSEDLLFDGYASTQNNTIRIYLDPAIMYTKPLTSSKSAVECFPISEEEGKDIDELRETFPNKADLRAVLEDYFHIYDDWAEIGPLDFDRYFEDYIGEDYLKNSLVRFIASALNTADLKNQGKDTLVRDKLKPAIEKFNPEYAAEADRVAAMWTRAKDADEFIQIMKTPTTEGIQRKGFVKKCIDNPNLMKSLVKLLEKISPK